MRDKYKKLLSDTGLFTIGSLGSKLLLIMLVPLYTHTLTTQQYGVAELIATTIVLTIPFITLSVNDSVLRFSLSRIVNKENVLGSACIVLTGSAALIAASYPIWMHFSPFGEWTGYFLVLLVLQCFRSAFAVYLKSVDRVRVFVIDGILYTAILAATSIPLLVVYDLGLNGFFIAQIIALSASLVIQFTAGGIVVDLRASHFDSGLMQRMIAYSTPLIASAVSWWVIISADRYILNYFSGTADVGVYALAAKLPALVTTLTSVFSQAWVITSIGEHETTRDSLFYSKIFSTYSASVFIASALVISVIRPFVLWYVGPNFSSSWRYVPALILGSVFYAYATFFMAFYKADRRNLLEVRATVTGAILSVLLNIALIPHFGIWGAVISAVLTFAVLALYSILDTQRFMPFYLHSNRLWLSSLVLATQATLVSLELYPVSVSIVTLSLIALINRNAFVDLAAALRRSLFK